MISLGVGAGGPDHQPVGHPRRVRQVMRNIRTAAWLCEARPRPSAPPERPNHPGWWRLERIPHVPGWKVRLGLARGGFVLHPGSRSWGCITVDKNDPGVMQYFNLLDVLLADENGNNYLTVF